MSSLARFDVTFVNHHLCVATATQTILIDSHEVEQFARELLAIIDRQDTTLLVDFAAVKRISTAVINELLMAKKRLLGSGGDLFLCGLQDAVRHNFRILNLEETVFQVFETQASALASLRQTSPP